jgi:peptide-methionine (S)-S-oxide reductase
VYIKLPKNLFFMDKATFGAGCFWHVELEFSKLKGVRETTVGYMGGHKKNPTYKEICKGETGHVEVCQVTFDQNMTSFENLLKVFWNMHDPTQKNRQGFDIGTQYQSVIFYHSSEQRDLAEISKQEQEIHLGKKIATTIDEAKKFYKAEEYHQKYLKKRSKNTC